MMTNGTDASYETKTVRTLRGQEDRTIRKWEAEGWECVSQKPGTIRTEIELRRIKPRSRSLPWIIGAAAVFALILAAVITVGVISERNSAGSASESPVATAPSSVATSTKPSATPTPDSGASAKCLMTGASSHCTFGQTIVYTDSTREGDVALEVTVEEPVSFMPSASATFLNNRATQMTPLPVNVYFPVTIKNLATEAKDGDFVFAHAVNAKEGETEVLSVSDGEVEGLILVKSFAPGESYQLKSGWSMSTLEGVEFRISIDGLAGGSATFTK